MLRSGLASASIQALNRLITLLIAILLARTLGSEGYGIYAFVVTIMGLSMVVAEAGVPALLMREVAVSQSKSEWSVLRGTLLRAGQFVGSISTSLSLIGLAVLWSLEQHLPRPTFLSFALMLAVLPLNALNRTITHAIKGLQRVIVGQSMESVAQPAALLLTIASLFVFFPTTREPQYAMLGQLVAAILMLTISFVALYGMLPTSVIQARPAYHNQKWLKSLLPFTLIGGAGILNSNIDILMLGYFRDAEEIGVYRVAMQGGALVVFGLQATNTVVASRFARLYAQNDMPRLQSVVISGARMALLFALPVALAFVFAGDRIAGWVFGVEFERAHWPLAILSLGQLVSAAFGSVGFLLNMTGNEAVVSKTLWQTVVLNTLLNLILIPTLGMVGAAIASAVSLSLWNALLFRYVRSRLGLNSTAFGKSGA